MNLTPGLQIQLRIDKMSIGSGGVGRYHAQVVFVQRSAPGDLLLVEITEIKKNFARGKILQILEPSSHRIPPPCVYYDSCGGCSWQHLQYEEQLNQKLQIVSEQLSKAGLSFPPIQVWRSPKEFRYRDRVRLKFRTGQFGYFGLRSHDFVAIEDCLIVDESVMETARQLRNNRAEATELELSKNDGRVIVRDLAEEGGLFTQANAELNKELIRLTTQIVEAHGTRKIFDLYCGEGNFSFPLLAQLADAEIQSVEGNPHSVAVAQDRCRKENIPNRRLQFHHASVELALQCLSMDERSSVILDPPRTGCTPFVIETLAQAQPQALVYISCHPASLSRDLTLLQEQSKGSYEVRQIHLFDMFPQTEHIETLVELRRHSAIQG